MKIPETRRSRETACPTNDDARKRVRTRMPPGSLCLAMASMLAEAMQPQFEQSGSPPNWQGAMGLVRSAEMHSVV